MKPGSNTPDTASTAAVLAQWDQWLSETTDQLMDIEASATGARPDVQMDVAAAFVCRKAIADRVEAMRAAGGGANALAQQPLVDDRGDNIGADLASAATLLSAVLDRVQVALGADEAAARDVATSTMSAVADLARAGTLAVELGQYVQRVAAVREQVDAAGRSSAALRDAAAAAAAVRIELEAMASERDQLFRRWSSVAETIEQHRQREQRVRQLVDRCREKVRPLPTLAVPSVDALGEPAAIDQLRAMPWPAARTLMQPMIDRLDRLAGAYDEIEQRFSAVLQRRDELRGLLHAFRDKAGGSSLAEDPGLEPLFRQAESELWSAPCDVERAGLLVADYTTAVNRMISERPNAARPNGDRGAR